MAIAHRFAHHGSRGVQGQGTERPAGGRPGGRVGRWRKALIALSFGSVPGCIYDGSDRCGENQDFSNGLCVCDERSVLIGRQCERCGKNEIPGDAECICEPGFERDGEGDCVEVLTGLGESCDGDEDCPSDGASHCAPHPTAGGYCTKPDCSSYQDCPAEYGCETQASPTFCQRPPTGLGAECSEPADCAAFEANYCETLQENVCLQSCLDDPGICQGDWVCCDFSSLVGTALCVPPGELSFGQCPLGGSILEGN